jgi:ATP synthase protein I
MVRPLSRAEGLFSRAHHGQSGEPFSMPPESEELRALGRKIEEARGGDQRDGTVGSPSAMRIAGRFSTELVVAIVFCTGLGWLLDRWLHTAPIFIVIMFVLGAAAGIRNVMRAAKELNAEAAKYPAAPAKDDEE